ncbi:hypothetical protein KJ657_02535 [Patescibacteria group bacterium]|nr:hypothetical protein [Patescibacteria group bacterium]MBU1015944.1 hypothetical protein [Patescibacteria group bacterium]MBU1938409.1 hypothetical protein [Patescibacteria group bacterium]
MKFFNKSNNTDNQKEFTHFIKVKSVDVIGKPHLNKVTGELIETPHVHDETGTRPARPDELPKNSNKML